MIEPTAADILRTIEQTLASIIVPVLQETPERSAAATVVHLLRHAAVRIDQEPRVLNEDLQAIRPVLEQARAYFDTIGSPQDAASMQTALDSTLPHPADRARRSEAALEHALNRLIALRCEHGGTADYRHLRDAIRHYMVGQISREATLVHPAFAGQGPRR